MKGSVLALSTGCIPNTFRLHFTLLSDVTDVRRLSATIAEAESQQGPVFLLVPCAGQALTGYFAHLPITKFQCVASSSNCRLEHLLRQSMQLNYFGTLHAVKATAAGFMERNEVSLLFVVFVMDCVIDCA